MPLKYRVVALAECNHLRLTESHPAEATHENQQAIKHFLALESLDGFRYNLKERSLRLRLRLPFCQRLFNSFSNLLRKRR